MPLSKENVRDMIARKLEEQVSSYRYLKQQMDDSLRYHEGKIQDRLQYQQQQRAELMERARQIGFT